MTKLLMCIPAVALLLAGCSSEGRRAEKRLEIIRSGEHTSAQLCQEAKRVAEAYLEDGNEEEYRRWSRSDTADCAAARIEALGY